MEYPAKSDVAQKISNLYIWLLWNQNEKYHVEEASNPDEQAEKVSKLEELQKMLKRNESSIP